MAQQGNIVLYVPKDYEDEQIIERLEKLAEQRDRSLNYIVLQAVRQYLEREEGS